jgi:aminopeptidase N
LRTSEGQSVGWKNYHEQWLSEGLAQYFALLNADRVRGPELFNQSIRHARGWAVRESNQGAIYLGYRVGHIKKDGRIFRAVVYNKSAAVLQMLRRLIGDEAFFRGIRRFYRTWQYHKAGTEDLRKALEEEAGISLERFFERWIYNASLPDVKFSSRTETGPAGPEVARFEQSGEVSTSRSRSRLYADGRTTDILMKVTDRVGKRECRSWAGLSGPGNRDEATVAEFLG